MPGQDPMAATRASYDATPELLKVPLGAISGGIPLSWAVTVRIVAACKSAYRAGGVLVSLSVRGSAVRAAMMPGVVSVMVAQMVTSPASCR